MQTVNLPAAQLAMPAAAVQGGVTAGLLGGQGAQGDPFAMLLMSLLGGAAPGQLPQGLDGLLGGYLPMQGEEQPGEEPQELDAAMQMMAELMMGGMSGQPTAVLTANPALQAMVSPGGQTPVPLTQAAMQQPAAPSVVSQPQAGEQAGDIAGTIHVLEGRPDAQQADMGGQAGGQDSFMSAIQQAKQMLREQEPPRTDETALDVDQLQSQVDAGRFSRSVGKAAEAASLPQPAELVEQVRKGVFEQAFSGKEEFTVKLKPEGLGEITVKMVEKEQGITLQIITSNPQVAKMLVSELGALQNALRPYHAEVQQVVSQPQPSGEGTLAGGFANQDFSGHQHGAFAQQPAQTPWSAWEPGGEPPLEVDDPILADTGLDAYI